MQILFWGILLCSLSLRSQDYTKQFEAFKESVEAKNADALKSFISVDMAIPPMISKEQLNPTILERILSDVFQRMESVSFVESKPNEIVVFYDFKDEDTKDRQSSIMLDAEGKIKEIKIIEDLIRETREQRQGKNAEQPIADALTKKYPPEKIEFTTADNRVVVGNLYHIGADRPAILLCHQAEYNKYEYADIAPKLNEMGFNALAVDLSGGGTFAAHHNETVAKGTDLGNAIENRRLIFERVKQEMSTAFDYLDKRYNQNVIIWGSSFSANYAIAITARLDNAKAAISFSGLAKGLTSVLSTFEKPLFMTSSKEEVPRVTALMEGIPTKENIVHFIPESKGGHGSSVLWNGQPYQEEYWTALKAFLNTLK
ncbi:alpha/beta hydrolase [Spongiimicrobium salis]|uniref:alpha/beta hydrolase n=1 Tax=Spongiimicrobium salis TaxID=1667022 RepID=UPI00374D68B5